MAKSKYNINHDFFSSIDSELKAYLLGFFAADGCIPLRKDGRKEHAVSLFVQDSDVYVASLFANSISNKPLRTLKPQKIIQDDREYLCKPKVGIVVYSKVMVTDICNLGFGYNKKSKEKVIPNINTDLIRHFIRGYFDGDGTCMNCLVARKDRPIGNQAKATFAIPSQDLSILNSIKSELDAVLGITLKVYPTRGRNSSVLKSSNRADMIKIYHYFYDNAEYYINRKKDSFETIMLTPRELRDLKVSWPRNA